MTARWQAGDGKDCERGEQEKIDPPCHLIDTVGVPSESAQGDGLAQAPQLDSVIPRGAEEHVAVVQIPAQAAALPCVFVCVCLCVCARACICLQKDTCSLIDRKGDMHQVLWTAIRQLDTFLECDCTETSGQGAATIR
eukprot:1160836-Pelagomonas_calceolata.AAC.9